MDAKIGELKHSEPPKKFDYYLGEMMGTWNFLFSTIVTPRLGAEEGGDDEGEGRHGLCLGIMVTGSCVEERLLLIEFKFMVPRLPQRDTRNTCPYKNKLT